MFKRTIQKFDQSYYHVADSYNVGISIKITGGLILFGAVMVILSILGDMKDGEGTYWKIFYAGIGFMAFGAVLVGLFGRD